MGLPAPRILVADDQSDILQALRLLLRNEGFVVETAASPAAVLAALEDRDFDVLLMDLNYTRDTTSGREGLDVLARIHLLDASLPTVVMTAYGSVEGAVEAMRRGARDYLEKPWDNTRLVSLLRTQVELGRALRRSQRLESENQSLRREGLPDLVTESPAMRATARLMARVAPSDANALLLGEHGVGKEIAARWLHAASARAARPDDHRERRRALRGRVRERALRPPQGRLHRCEGRSHRALRARRQGHHLPRRDREHDAGTAGAHPSRPQHRRVRAGGILAHPAGRGAGLLRHQCRPRRRGGRRPLSRGPALPPQHHRDPHPAAARAAGGHSPARGPVPRSLRRALPEGAARLPARGDGRDPGVRLARQRPRARSHPRARRAPRRRRRDQGGRPVAHRR